MAQTMTAFRSLMMAGAAFAVVACSGGEDKAEAPKSRQTVTAATVTQTSLPRQVDASGSVSAWEEVPVGAEAGA